MNKLNKNVKNSLNLVWLIVTVMCVLITYYCMKVKATSKKIDTTIFLCFTINKLIIFIQ